MHTELCINIYILLILYFIHNEYLLIILQYSQLRHVPYTRKQLISLHHILILINQMFVYMNLETTLLS